MTRLLLLLFVAFSATASAQLNTTLRDNLPYDTGVNDIWGYVAPDGTEYAIVGLTTGVSFVSLADPDNVVEVARIPGDNSQWRDMKTFGTYAYSVADQRTSTEGITAYDLSQLPDTVTFTRNTYQIPGSATTFSRAHNLFIDEDRGIIYTSGGSQNVRDGGIIMFDINTTPMAPVYVGAGPPVYAHDVFVNNDTMFASEIYIGDLTLYDVSDFSNITELGRTPTPFDFTHNAWSTADGKYVFTTDEEPNAPVAAYDIRDKTDIKLLDEYRPTNSLNKGAIPHNAHVIGDFVSISYYTDGLRVVDASCPDNLVEVANYDTWLGADGDFNGAWGAFPFLPSGLTLVSDRQTGLYVIEVDYKSAAKLEGNLTDAVTGNPVNGVEVIINAPQPNLEWSSTVGDYKTGLGDGGTYTVTFAEEGYEELTIPIELVNGEILRVDTTLQPAIELFDVGFTLVDGGTGAPISGASINLTGRYNDFDIVTNADGTTDDLQLRNNQLYDVTLTAWGYRAQTFTGVRASELENIQVELAPGYEDDFVADLGWEVTSTAASGNWVRAVPVGTSGEGIQVAPGSDAFNDIGDKAYVTGNRGGSAGTDDVDDGVITLESPDFRALTDNPTEVMVHFSYWFVNIGGNPPLNDALTISIDNGQNGFTGASAPILVREYTENTNGWTEDSFNILDFTTLTDGMRIIISTGDEASSAHVVEAGFDRFFVTEKSVVSTEVFDDPSVAAQVYPNPSEGPFTLDYDAATAKDLSLRITDVNGRVVRSQKLKARVGRATIGQDLPAGLYLMELLDGPRRMWVGKAIRR